MSDNIIECSNMEKTYGEGAAAYRALRGVSFNIRRGDFVAIVGPSGCGKSTLMHLIGLLDRPSAGELTVLGHQAQNLSDSQRTKLRRKNIGFVFQAFNLLLRHTALENVCLPLSYAGVNRLDREMRAVELLTRVGLRDKVQNTPLELSGGERQRVAIARALANAPQLLLADEPTGNLDSVASAQIMDLFTELNAAGTTVAIVTHDANIAKKARRSIHIMDGLLA